MFRWAWPTLHTQQFPVGLAHRTYPAALRGHMSKTTALRHLLLSLAVALSCLLPVGALAQQSDVHKQKKILILNSYHRGYQGSDSMVDGFLETLLKERPTSEIQIEYLDSIHFSGKEYDDKILDLLRFKYQQHQFDLIFSTDDYAFNLLEKYRDSIFGPTPVIFCGTNSFDSSRLIGKQGFNGIDERPSFGDTVELIFDLHPQTSDIVVIHDTGVTGQRNSAEFRRQTEPYAKRARFSYLAGLGMEELEHRIKELKPGTVVVYFATYVEGRNGERIPTREAQQALSALSPVPFYGGWEFMLGKGIVGGRLLNLRQHGVLSAGMALRLLNNEQPGSLAKFTPSPNQYMFDYLQMSRFGIKESQLPPGSVVIKKPAGFLKTYRVPLLSGICAALLLALISIFVKLLKKRRELSASLEELKEAQSELLATARKAGMAEIAINVLHNVGNVLNSVNISAGLLTGLIRDSRVNGLSQTVQLLKQHAADLGDYLTRDEKGKLLPSYLEKLCEALGAERQKFLEELSQLNKSVDHIKDIVATQQSYAGAVSMVEPVLVADLVRDALRITDQALKNYGVTVVQELAEIPVLPLDKARILQILVNLVRNAGHAMEGMHDQSPRLTLRTELTENRMLRISVSDQGVGIAADNLSRIFSHGFTTRQRGHGFGLHSCALAAQEMGGTLTASSAGVGKGATFVLELPAGT